MIEIITEFAPKGARMELNGQFFMPDRYEVVSAGGFNGCENFLAIRFFPPADHPVLKEPIIVLLPRLAVEPFIELVTKGLTLFPANLRKEGGA